VGVPTLQQQDAQGFGRARLRSTQHGGVQGIWIVWILPMGKHSADGGGVATQGCELQQGGVRRPLPPGVDRKTVGQRRAHHAPVATPRGLEHLVYCTGVFPSLGASWQRGGGPPVAWGLRSGALTHPKRKS
jgi:hypothetical protein